MIWPKVSLVALICAVSSAGGELRCNDFTLSDCNLQQYVLWESNLILDAAMCQTTCHNFADCKLFFFLDGTCTLFNGDHRDECAVIGGSPLQSVDECVKVFDRDLEPILGSVGVCGVFAKKGGQVDEGLATFYRRDKFELISFESVFLPDALHTDPRYSYILDKVKNNDKLMNSLTNRTTTVSVAVLKHVVHNSVVIVGNTHLYFEPNADHIRLIQTEMCRAEIERVKQRILSDNADTDVSLIFCGDFNSTPPFGVVEYLTSGIIPADHTDWRSQDGEEVTGLHLNHEPIFSSAAGTPQYTNYTQGFKDCLDYIWIDKTKLEVSQVVPFPSEEELSLHTALPNIVFPSDHIPVIVDLKFK